MVARIDTVDEFEARRDACMVTVGIDDLDRVRIRMDDNGTDCGEIEMSMDTLMRIMDVVRRHNKAMAVFSGEAEAA